MSLSIRGYDYWKTGGDYYDILVDPGKAISRGEIEVPRCPVCQEQYEYDTEVWRRREEIEFVPVCSCQEGGEDDE